MSLFFLSVLLAASPVASDICPVNQRTLRIPIRIDPARRAEIKELHLFSSADLGHTWNMIAVASPEQDAFPFVATTDGTYWLCVQVVDQHGNVDPADIYRAPPSQKILIDTLQPIPRITLLERQGDDVLLAWEIQEDNPDFASLRLEYRSADSPAESWMPVAVSPLLCGQARFRAPTKSGVIVRLQIRDFAGNVGECTRELAASQGSAPAGIPTAVAPIGVNPYSPNGTPGVDPYRSVQPASAPPMPAASYPPIASAGVCAPTSNYQMVSGGTSYQTPNGASNESGRLLASSDATATRNTAVEPVSGSAAPGGLPPAQLINTTQISLDYTIAHVGPSGVGKVELYVTRDDGRTWERFAEDPHLKSPMTVDLPGEGLYGLRLVVQSRAGLGKRPPVSGDLPEMRVEVDTTAPAARLYAPEADPSQRNALLLKWTAYDRNLAANPITLEWSERPDQGWQTIARDLPNSGRFSWALPVSIPPQVYLRLSARDNAGNVGVAETSRPELIDLAEPEGHLVGLK